MCVLIYFRCEGTCIPFYSRVAHAALARTNAATYIGLLAKDGQPALSSGRPEGRHLQS